MGYNKKLGNYASHTKQMLISLKKKSKLEFVVYYRNEKCYKLFEGNILAA